MICYKHISIFLIGLTISFICSFAQTRDGAKKQMNAGNYLNAVEIYSVLEDFYPGEYTEELKAAKECQRLINEATAFSKKGQYSQAIERYRLVKKINPSDPNVSKKIKECERLRAEYQERIAIETDWANCVSLEDYRAFVKSYPNSKYDQTAQSKIKELEQKDDEAAWRKAKENNTTYAYEHYLNNYKIHQSDAKRRLGDLYELQAYQYFQKSQFGYAKNSYEKAKQYKSLPEGSLKYYSICCEEVDFSDLKASRNRGISAIKKFQVLYPNSKYLQIVNGFLLDYYCYDMHWFDEARKVAKEQSVASSDGVLHDKRWWQKYINEAERQYKKSNKNVGRSQSSRTPQSRSTNDPIYSSKTSFTKTHSENNSVGIMFGVGANYDLSGFSGYSFLGVEGSFSLGTFKNRLNAELAFRPCKQLDFSGSGGQSISFICPITVGTRLNICRVTPSNSFYLYIQPEIGYAIGASGIYGGRFGLGFKDVGSIYIDVLGSFKPLSPGTNYESNLLFGTIGLTFYIW